jgi:hypothetical protein
MGKAIANKKFRFKINELLFNKRSFLLISQINKNIRKIELLLKSTKSMVKKL